MGYINYIYSCLFKKRVNTVRISQSMCMWCNSSLFRTLSLKFLSIDGVDACQSFVRFHYRRQRSEIMVGSNNFEPWACHLVSENFLSFAVAIHGGLPSLFCGMVNCGLGSVCYQIPYVQETSWDFSSRRILTHNFLCHRGAMEAPMDGNCKR